MKYLPPTTLPPVRPCYPAPGSSLTGVARSRRYSSTMEPIQDRPLPSVGQSTQAFRRLYWTTRPPSHAVLTVVTPHIGPRSRDQPWSSFVSTSTSLDVNEGPSQRDNHLGPDELPIGILLRAL
jgi:hypothetical protein